jgi:hypothetical protein
MEICDAENSTQVDQRNEPVKECMDAHLCKCNSLYLNDIVSEFRSEFRDTDRWS